MKYLSDSKLSEIIVHGNAIDPEALRDVYNQFINENCLAQADRMLNELHENFPNDGQVQHLMIALCIQQKKYTDAMRRTESLVAQCKPEEGLIDAALAVRSKIGTESMSPPNDGETTISLCMVVKNEMAGLGACLNGAKKLVDEIIVADTGSTDRTMDVARIFGARLFEFQWQNDFAAARNFSLEKATGDWVLILDADEIIAAKDHDALRELLNQGRQDRTSYSIETRNYTHLANAIGWHANDGSYRQYETGTGWFPTRKVRLFPRTDAIRFRFPVHERVDASIREVGIPIVDCPIPVHHYGYLNEVNKKEKSRLYLQLGYEKIEQYKDDLEAIRELAVQAGQLEQWSIAIELWHRFIKIKPDYAEAHVNLSGIYWQSGQYDRALASAYAAIALDQNLKEAHYNVAVSLMFMGRVIESRDILEKILLEHEGYIGARFMLAAVLSFTGDPQQGAQELEVCQSAISNEAISMAVENLIARLKKNHLEAFGLLLEKASALVN